jgi:hypothetical protein
MRTTYDCYPFINIRHRTRDQSHASQVVAFERQAASDCCVVTGGGHFAKKPAECLPIFAELMPKQQHYHA